MGAPLVTQEFAITLDADWAPDCAIDYVAERLIAAKVKATWFITNGSPAVERLRKHPDLFELGVHPNFMEGSSHGAKPQEVLAHVMGLVPEAVSVRTHGLVQSTRLFALMLEQTPLRNDVSLLLSYASDLQVTPLRIGTKEMRRVPTFWEDDLEVDRADARWDVSWVPERGVKVFAFHPLAIAINWNAQAQYLQLRAAAKTLSELTNNDVQSARNTVGSGAETMFDLLLASAQRGAPTRTIRELARP
jgi:hypothetical protein